MHQARRDLGEKYKDVTPEPLKDYIYHLNLERYGDRLGPSFDSLVSRALDKGLSEFEAFEKIIKSSSTPNSDVNTLFSRFGDWLNTKSDAYLDRALVANVGG